MPATYVLLDATYTSNRIVECSCAVCVCRGATFKLRDFEKFLLIVLFCFSSCVNAGEVCAVTLLEVCDC